MFWLFAIVALGCSTTSVELAQDCDVRLTSIEPSAAAPGATISAHVAPVTTVWDTAVYVGRQRAQVLAVDRINCEACDECKQENRCTECEDCDACDAECDENCVESISFTAISAPSSQYPVSIFNGYGQSNSQDFQLLEAAAPDPDTGSGADTATETGSAPIDSGVDDATDTGEGIPTDSGGK